MKKQLFILSSLCLILSACSNEDHRNTPPNADNTGRNVRDRNSQTVTPGNQSETEMDRTITQHIRQAIMDDNSFTTDAKNVKIITINGVVTLRGPVNSENERNEIARKARAVAGVRNVDNQLEIVRKEANKA